MTVFPGDLAGWLGGPQGPPTEVRQDHLAEICELAATSCWQVLPAIAHRLETWGSPEILGASAVQRLQERAMAIRVFAKLQLNLCLRLISSLESRGIPYALLKASAVRVVAYSTPEERCGYDIDFAVPKSALAEAREVAFDLGFLPARWNPSTRRFYQAELDLHHVVEAGHYELGLLVRRQRLRGLQPEVEAVIRREIEETPHHHLWHLTETDEIACYASLDVHHGLTHEVAVEDLVRSAERRLLHGLPVRVPQTSWLAFHLIFKLYWEGVHHYRKGIYQYADLVRLLPCMDAAQTQLLFEILRRFRLEAAGYYVLRRLESDFGLVPSEQLRTFLEEAAQAPDQGDPTSWNDLGDMWPKLWGFR